MHSLNFKGRNRDPGAGGTGQSHHTELLEVSPEGSAGIDSRGSNKKNMVPLRAPHQGSLMLPRCIRPGFGFVYVCVFACLSIFVLKDIQSQ